MVIETDLELSDSRRLHVYDTCADDAGTSLAIFWHHGTPNIGAPPAPLLPAAAKLGMRWVSYDRPGYGGSSPKPGGDVASAAADVSSIADALGLRQFVVMGHSGGSPHALACGALMPERVLGVVCVAGLAPFHAEGLEWWAGSGSTPPPRRTMLRNSRDLPGFESLPPPHSALPGDRKIGDAGSAQKFGRGFKHAAWGHVMLRVVERKTQLVRPEIWRNRQSLAREKPKDHTSDTLARAVLELQRSGGNAAVTEMISAQRDRGHALAAPATTELDDQARAIIAAAQAATPGIDERAVNVVGSIINTYYSDKKGMVSAVSYTASEPGLLTTSNGSGEKATGSIAVGHYFVTNTTDAYFARRVLQVGHELEHVQQHREGKGGEGHRHEREFLAFYHEALNAAPAHTGRISHSTRVELMDQAIRNYNAMPDDQKRQYADKYRELLDRRTEEQRKSGHTATDPPTERAQ